MIIFHLFQICARSRRRLELGMKMHAHSRNSHSGSSSDRNSLASNDGEPAPYIHLLSVSITNEIQGCCGDDCILARLMPSISRFFNIIFGGNYILSQWRMSLKCAQCTPLWASEMKADLTAAQKVYIEVTIFGCIQWHDFGGRQSKLDVVPAGPRANRGRLKRHLTCRRPLAPKSLLGRLMFGGLQTEVRKSWR